MRRGGAPGGVRGKGISLRARIALVIAALAILPNALLAAGVLLPALGGGGGIASELWVAGALWALAVVVLSALVGYFASRELLEPLTRLQGEVAELTSRSDRLVGARLGSDRGEPSEVEAVRAAFNRLLARVELEQGRRSAFIATLMHDLKTPLVATSHLLEVIRDRDDLGRAERVDLSDRLLHENRAFVELVDKLVAAHKFDRDEVALSRERVDVAEVVRVVLERLEPIARERGVRMHAEGKASAMADRKELERALYNLVANAVRYARGHLTIEIFSGLVRIADDGPGLPAPLERLAQPFNDQPVEISGQSYRAGSAGLGLFIARRILEAHGGRLVAEGSGPKGTVLLAYLGSEGKR